MSSERYEVNIRSNQVETPFMQDPLKAYFTTNKIPIYTEHEASFQFPSTKFFWEGRWVLENEKLFLVDLKGKARKLNLDSEEKILSDNTTINLSMDLLFPGQEKVFSAWFTGFISFPEGSIIRPGNDGMSPTYEAYNIILFKEGVLQSSNKLSSSI